MVLVLGSISLSKRFVEGKVVLMGVYIEKLEILDEWNMGEVLCSVESEKGRMDWELERGSSAVLQML